MSFKQNTIIFFTFTLLLVACLGKDLRDGDSSSSEENSVEDHKEAIVKFIKETCIANAGEEKGEELFNTFKKSAEDLKECVRGIFKEDEVKSDYQKAATEKSYAPLFHKYCGKRSELSSCVDTFDNKVSDCYDKDDQELRQGARRLLNALLDFACEKDGENVMNFINDNGSECLKSKLNEIRECAKTNFADLFPKDKKDFKINKITVTEKECNSGKKFKTCLFDELEKCEQKSAVTFVEALFKHLKSEFDYCSKYEKN